MKSYIFIHFLLFYVFALLPEINFELWQSRYLLFWGPKEIG
jgi:hypothetical protein